MIFAAAGCSDDETNGTDITEHVRIASIILNPKSAEPGDTVQATVVVQGQTVPGSFPAVEWSASGGTFLSNGKTSVGWVAPTTSGVYRLTCKVTSSSNSDTHESDVFVGQTTLIVPQDAGEIQLVPSSSDFFYLHNFGEEGAWDSSSVYEYTGGGAPIGPGSRVGAQFAFSDGASMPWAAFAAIESLQTTNTEDPINVYLVDLGNGIQTAVTTDQSLPGGSRHHQFENPYFSPDNSALTFQGFLPHPQSGSIDTLDVFVYDIALQQTVNVTASDDQSDRRRNMFPMYSTDHAWLVFVADRQFRDDWDLFGAPITSGVVDTQLSSVVQLTTGAMIGSGLYNDLGDLILEWNSVQSIIAVVGGRNADGLLHLVQTTGSGATTTDVNDTGNAIIEVSWAPSGQAIGVSSLIQDESGSMVNALFTVTTGGTATHRHTVIAGDRIVDLGWSPNGQFMVYRVVRATQSWFELIDIDAGTDFLAPVVITPTQTLGNRASYAAEMNTATHVGTSGADTIVYMLLFGDEVTPAISTLNITGALQP
jgi:Tol biopolymer transport system component